MSRPRLLDVIDFRQGDAGVVVRPGSHLRLFAIALLLATKGVCDDTPAGPDVQNDEQPPLLELRGDDIQAEIGHFKHDVRADFGSENFGALETLSAQLIADKARFDNGSWKIYQFHAALEPTVRGSEDAMDARIQKWEAQYPLSVTARIAHVMLFTDYAWEARGGGWASEVTPQGMQLFSERLVKANDELTAARRLDQKSPMLWGAGLVVALGQGWSKDDAMEFYNEGKAFEPSFWNLDVRMATFLLPRWYGESGEWEKLAEDEIGRSGGLGEEGYARTVFAMAGYHKNVFKETRARWTLARKGYLLMRERYPNSKAVLSEFAFLAVEAGDKPLARSLFKEFDGHGDPGVWRTLEYLQQCEQWAYGIPN